MQQRKSSARHKAVTDTQRGAALAAAARAAKGLKAPAEPSTAQSGTVAMTLGGHADRGLTLAALYDTGVLGKLRLDVRVRLVTDLTQSLAWLHANPRLMSAHRHLLIAPSTIVIGLDGVARVDLRAAKKPTSERGELEADYCAPEVQSGDAADHRADIFSVGVLAWEALAGTRLADALFTPTVDGARFVTEGADDDTRGVPAALGGGHADREPARGRAPARTASKTQPRRRRTVPPLSLPEDADWAMPFAQLALSAMSPDVSQRPQDCRALIGQLELIDLQRLATNQEIAEVVQGLSAVATLCVPEPVLPATDAVCQVDGGNLAFMDREPCASPELERCVQPELPASRRVPAPTPQHTAGEPSLAAPPAPAATHAGSRALAGYSTRIWFMIGLPWLALLGLLAGYVASLLSR